MILSKPVRILGLALFLLALAYCAQQIGGVFEMWDAEKNEPRIQWLVPISLFVIGAVIMIGSGRKGEKHLSLGCGAGAVLLMAFLALLAFAWLLDIESWS